MMKRLAIILPELSGGGAEKVLLAIAEELARKGIDVSFLLIRKNGVLLKTLPEKIPVHSLGGESERWFFLCCLIALFKLTIHFRSNAESCCYLSSLTGTNLLVMLARILAGKGHIVLREAVTKENKTSYLLRLLVRYLYPKATAIIAVSPDVANDLQAHFGVTGVNIRTILNPVDTDAIRFKAQADTAHPWFIEGHSVFVATGRLAPQKDYSTLLLAFSYLLEKQEARLFIIGDGPERTKLEALATELNIATRVHFTGFLENPYSWMAKASAFVLSSRYEGCANVLIEAMATGVKLIATDCPGGSRLILGGGSRGQLVPIGDARALAKAMAAVTANTTPEPASYSPFLGSIKLSEIANQYQNTLQI